MGSDPQSYLQTMHEEEHKNCELREKEAEKYTVIENALVLKAHEDRIIILEDRFRTGYECKICDGLCVTEEACPQCNGSKYRSAEEILPCPSCRVDGEPTGKKLCSECNGKGASVIIPQNAERRPTSGKIVSAGPLCEVLKTGDHVLYHNFVGVAINVKGKTVIRIMHESEILAIMFVLKEDFNLGRVMG
jgi:co-chaperonin GroES (HSP10)